MRRIALLGLAIAASAAMASAATASQLIDRNASHESLLVNNKGEAMLSYMADGKVKHVLVWGAINAVPPTRARRQVEFNIDYSGGYKKYKVKQYWTHFNGACLPYDGPALAWKVTACKSTDGSYWALQAWQRAL